MFHNNVLYWVLHQVTDEGFEQTDSRARARTRARETPGNRR